MMWWMVAAWAADFSGTAQPNTGAVVTIVGASKQATVSFEQYGQQTGVFRASVSAPLDEASGRAALLGEEWGSATIAPGVSGFIEFGGTTRVMDSQCLALGVSRDVCSNVEKRWTELSEDWKEPLANIEKTQKLEAEAANTLAEAEEDLNSLISEELESPEEVQEARKAVDVAREDLRNVQLELAPMLEYTTVSFDSTPAGKVLLQLRMRAKNMLYTIEELEEGDIEATCKALDKKDCDGNDLSKLASTRRYQTAIPNGVESTLRIGGNYAGFKGRTEPDGDEQAFSDFGIYAELKIRSNFKRNQAGELSLRGSYGSDHDEKEWQRCTTAGTDDPSVLFASCAPALLVSGSRMDTFSLKTGGRWSVLFDGALPGVLKAGTIGEKDAVRFGLEVSAYVTGDVKTPLEDDVDSQFESVVGFRVLPFIAPAKDTAKVNMGVGFDVKYALTDQAVFGEQKPKFNRGSSLMVPFVYIGGVLDPRMR